MKTEFQYILDFFNSLNTYALYLVLALVVAQFIWKLPHYVPLKLWFKAIFSGVKVGISDLILMRLRKSPAETIIDELITAKKANVCVNHVELEIHCLAGGDISSVIRALISAKDEGIDVPFKKVAEIDLVGLDISSAIQSIITAAKKGRDIDTAIRLTAKEAGIDFDAVLAILEKEHTVKKAKPKM